MLQWDLQALEYSFGHFMNTTQRQLQGQEQCKHNERFGDSRYERQVPWRWMQPGPRGDRILCPESQSRSVCHLEFLVVWIQLLRNNHDYPQLVGSGALPGSQVQMCDQGTFQSHNRMRALEQTIPPPLPCLPSNSEKRLVQSSEVHHVGVQTTNMWELQDALWLLSMDTALRPDVHN